jgi:5'-3' exoribonuclease 1
MSTIDAAATRDAELRTLPPSPCLSFDSNLLTPGTELLATICERLEAWSHSWLQAGGSERAELKVVISPATEPGEGEHKIVKQLRMHRAHVHRARSTSAPHPPPPGAPEPLPPPVDSMSHGSSAIFGQDADLLLLSLVSHVPHVFILREVRA